jgi:hypothetical protein
MSDWLGELPFVWLLIAVLALSYIAATAIYTRVMMLVIDRRGRITAKQVNREGRTSDESPVEIAGSDTSTPPLGARADNISGPAIGWDRLLSGDIERVKRALAARRAYMLSRHAEELKILGAEQAEIDAIETAINTFVQRYKRGAEGEDRRA